MLLELEKDNLAEIIADNKKVVVQYSATWCGNCRIMKPKFKKESSSNEDITFILADAEKFPESRKLANVDNLPTFASFENGSLKNQVQTNKYDVLHIHWPELYLNSNYFLKALICNILFIFGLFFQRKWHEIEGKRFSKHCNFLGFFKFFIRCSKHSLSFFKLFD